MNYKQIIKTILKIISIYPVIKAGIKSIVEAYYQKNQEELQKRL